MARHRRPIAVAYALAAVAGVVFVAGCGGSTARVTRATEKTTGRAHAAQAGGMVVGIISGTAGWSDQGVGERLTQVISRTHATWLRESFYWSEIEPRPCARQFGPSGFHLAIQASLYALRNNILKFLRRLLLLFLDG